jgi:hypothetical protein
MGERTDTVACVRQYTDEQLARAVVEAHSWRGVLRRLGLAATSAGAMRSVRGHADRLALDHSHFRGQRRWSEQQLETAVASSHSWMQVCEELGLTGGSSVATVRGHAARLGLDTTHLTPVSAGRPAPETPQPRMVNLPRAGSLLAASWFELCGLAVSWPLEPCRYDLFVWRPEGAERIQVKTGTLRTRSSWMVRLSSSRGEMRTYDPDEIDQFFVIDGDFDFYLIPISVVGGLTAIHVSAYEGYKLPKAPWLTGPPRPFD